MDRWTRGVGAVAGLQVLFVGCLLSAATAGLWCGGSGGGIRALDMRTKLEEIGARAGAAARES